MNGVEDKRARRGLSRPTQLVLGWAGLIVIGAVVFRLPVSAEGDSLGWVDSLFTSTSAVCVTGLSTIVVCEDLSSFGQAVLLALIQIGGLGISTVSTLLLFAVGGAALSDQYQTQESLAAIRVKPMRLLMWVVGFTLISEAAGAYLLAGRLGGPNRPDAWWLGLFHSVSAFCNAGFSLFPDSLTRFRSDVGVNGVICGLIALGGLGFVVLRQLVKWSMAFVLRRRLPMFLHTRTVLQATVSLWVLGGLLFLNLEWRSALAGLDASTSILSSVFQSVTSRTAGFNTLDFGAMREPTLFFTMFLMFVGGAPGSCAGGVKVTTMMVILATARAHCRGTNNVALLKRTIPPEVVKRAFQLLTLSLIFLAGVVAALLISEEHLAVPKVAGGDRFTVLAFEAVSAFGTVGLSTGVTASLSAGGKLAIVVCMFVGRLGPLLVALAVFAPRRPPAYEYPKEDVAIG